jgi:hypothetical protein
LLGDVPEAAGGHAGDDLRLPRADEKMIAVGE